MVSLEFLQNFAYLIYIVALAGYVVLDGFDLGVGSLYLLIRGDKNRRVLLNAIGPVWDGNAVWIVITLGILLGAFPNVFSAMLSGLYIPSMTIVFGFMLRSVSMEFRSKIASRAWRATFDCTFGIGSLITTFTLGLVVANLVQGLPLDSSGQLIKEHFAMFDLYSGVCAFMVLCMFSLHGALFLLIKCENPLKQSIQKIAYGALLLLVLSWIVVAGLTHTYRNTVIDHIPMGPMLISVPILVLLLQVLLFVALRKGRALVAFCSSSAIILLMIALYASSTYPYIILSSTSPYENSLTIFEHSSSYISLFVIFIVGITGVPLSFFYFRYLYKIFAGKVVVDEGSY